MTALERQILALRGEHDELSKRLEIVTIGVQAILTEVQKLASQLVSHTADESEKHKDRVKLLLRISMGVGAVITILSSIYAVLTGTSLSSSVQPMLKTLLGL